MTDLIALALVAVLTRGGPDPGPQPPGGPSEIVLYEDDPALGQVWCDEELKYHPAGSTCRVEPTPNAPDVTQPGWANPFGP